MCHCPSSTLINCPLLANRANPTARSACSTTFVLVVFATLPPFPAVVILAVTSVTSLIDWSTVGRLRQPSRVILLCAHWLRQPSRHSLDWATLSRCCFPCTSTARQPRAVGACTTPTAPIRCGSLATIAFGPTTISASLALATATISRAAQSFATWPTVEAGAGPVPLLLRWFLLRKRPACQPMAMRACSSIALHLPLTFKRRKAVLFVTTLGLRFLIQAITVTTAVGIALESQALRPAIELMPAVNCTTGALPTRTRHCLAMCCR